MPSTDPKAAPSTLAFTRRVLRFCRGRARLDEVLETAVPGFYVVHGVSRDRIEPALYNPSLCVVLQGEKETTAGAESRRVREGDLVVVSHHVPVMVRFTEASVDAPYVALVLDLDLSIARDLDAQMESVEGSASGSAAIEVGPVDRTLLATFERLFRCAEDDEDARILGPLVVREIHYRVLQSVQGRVLRELLHGGSQAGKIARALAHLRRHFREPVAVSEVAELAAMSLSTFHEHFRAVTATTPLQYQKDLRLIEAQRLLRSGESTVSAAAFDVGYESVSQFSREYARKFGRPPREDRA